MKPPLAVSRAPNAVRPLRLVFITCAVDAPFFGPVKKGMNDAAAMLGVKCEFRGTKGVDVRAQADLVRKAVEEGVDGIALNIVDPVAFDAVVREAIDRGVPVVGFNVDDQATPNARLSSVNQRLREAGEKLAGHCLPRIPEGAHVLMTMHDEGVSALMDRMRGMQEVLEKKKIRSTVLVTGNESAKGAEVIYGFLGRHPEIRIVLGTGQSDTEAAGIAVEKYLKGTGTWCAGFDLSEKTLQLIRDGHMLCTVDQQPYIQGFYPVVQLTLYLRYGLMPSDIDAGAAIIEKKNVDQVSDLTRQGYR